MSKPIVNIKDPLNKYNREVVTLEGLIQHIDVYRVLIAFESGNPVLDHISKKSLCAGLRGHKDRLNDYKDIQLSINKLIEYEEQRVNAPKSPEAAPLKGSHNHVVKPVKSLVTIGSLCVTRAEGSPWYLPSKAKPVCSPQEDYWELLRNTYSNVPMLHLQNFYNTLLAIDKYEVITLGLFEYLIKSLKESLTMGFIPYVQMTYKEVGNRYVN